MWLDNLEIDILINKIVLKLDMYKTLNGRIETPVILYNEQLVR